MCWRTIRRAFVVWLVTRTLCPGRANGDEIADGVSFPSARRALAPELPVFLKLLGKSVLVTSHTTKALRMVRQHIVPELRPCVSACSKVIWTAASSSRAPWGRSRKGCQSRRGLARNAGEEIGVRAPRRAEEARRNPKPTYGGPRRRVSGYRHWRKVLGTRDAARKSCRKRKRAAGSPAPSLRWHRRPFLLASWPTSIVRVFRFSAKTSMNSQATFRSFTIFESEDFESQCERAQSPRHGRTRFAFRLVGAGAAQSSPGEIEGLAAALVQAVEPLSVKTNGNSPRFMRAYGDVHRQPGISSSVLCGGSS